MDGKPRFPRRSVFVDATFSTRLPLEMFHRIGDAYLFAVDAGFDEALSRSFPAGPTKGFPSMSF